MRSRILMLAVISVAAALPSSLEAGDVKTRNRERGDEIGKLRMLREKGHGLRLDESDFKDANTFLKALKNKHPFLYQKMSSLQKDDPERFREAMFALQYAQRNKEPLSRQGNNNTAKNNTNDFTEHEKKRETLRSEIQELIEKYKKSEGADKEKIRREIREKAEKAFDMTTTTRSRLIEKSEQKLEEARRKLRFAREQLKRRQTNRKNHIDSFLEKIDGDAFPEEVKRPIIHTAPPYMGKKD